MDHFNFNKILFKSSDDTLSQYFNFYLILEMMEGTQNMPSFTACWKKCAQNAKLHT